MRKSRVTMDEDRYDGYPFREGTGADEEEERQRPAETSEEHGSEEGEGVSCKLKMILAFCECN